MRVSVVFLSLAVAPCYAQVGTIIRPDPRFVQYSDLCDDVKEAVDALGYNETGWNDFGVIPDIELLDYETIQEESPDDVEYANTILGDDCDEESYQPSWDCYINHYENYGWTEMEAETQDYWEVLGWNIDNWDGDAAEPDSEEALFGELSAEEQSAAESLCYSEETWNGESLVDFGEEPSCGLSCFSSFDVVDVKDKGSASVDSLEIGDYVRSGKEGEYSRVYSFSHFDHEKKNDFLQIHAEGLELPLEISKRHMLYVNDKMRPASQVKEGDILDGDKKVSEIKKVERRGVYAPVTESGKVVVNGVLSSSYVALLDHFLINMHAATHAFFAPHRMVCAFNFEFCEKETYTNGYSNWIYHAMHFVEWVNTFSAPVQALASIVAAPILGSLVVMEHFVLSSLFVTSLLTLAGYLYTKNKTGMSKVY